MYGGEGWIKADKRQLIIEYIKFINFTHKANELLTDSVTDLLTNRGWKGRESDREIQREREK